MTSRTRADDGGLAFGDLAAAFRAHRAELVRLAAFILADKSAGEDVVQDVFAQIHARQGTFGERGQGMPASPLPYLHRAVVNGCRSALRRRRLTLRHAEQDSPCPPLSAEEAALLSEDRRQVLAALVKLPARRREVLVLRYYAGLSEAEIAVTLGISTGTVKSTAARGLAALAHALKETR